MSATAEGRFISLRGDVSAFAAHTKLTARAPPASDEVTWPGKPGARDTAHGGRRDSESALPATKLKLLPCTFFTKEGSMSSASNCLAARWRALAFASGTSG